MSSVGFRGISRRDNERPVNQALNACSVFMAGIFLRWALLHRLAPTHGFLHEPSSYIALIYDLMEPVRWWMEAAVFEAVSQATDEKKYTPYALENLKKMMDVVVYVPVTRQTVRRKSVAHGLVLALRAYLMGDMRRLVLPAEGKQEAGRPMKISYRLPAACPAIGQKKPPRRTGAALCSIEASQGIGQARSADNLSVSKNYIRLFPVSPNFLFPPLAPDINGGIDIGVHKNQSAPLKHAALFQFFIAQFNKRFLHIHKRG